MNDLCDGDGPAIGFRPKSEKSIASESSKILDGTGMYPNWKWARSCSEFFYYEHHLVCNLLRHSLLRLFLNI